MQFAKIDTGRLTMCPQTGRSGDGALHLNLPSYYTMHPDQATADGWKVYTETDRPAGAYVPHYEEAETTITRVYEPYDEPEVEPEPTIEERVDMIEDAVIEMSEILYGGDDDGEIMG